MHIWDLFVLNSRVHGVLSRHDCHHICYHGYHRHPLYLGHPGHLRDSRGPRAKQKDEAPLVKRAEKFEGL